jgi:lipoprotein-anchoring transpeptidase ErfK/SrfK
MTVTSLAAATYSVTRFDKDAKLGYARSGSRIPVRPEPLSKENCTKGWYALVDGGYICGNHGVVAADGAKTKLAMTPPNLEGVLPYRYARNSKNGTPLYKSIPTPEQMRQYEPYLREAEEKKANDASAGTAPDAQSSGAEAPAPPTRPASVSAEVTPNAEAPSPGALAPADTGEATASEPPKPWWDESDEGKRLHEVTLEHMRAEADGVLEMRMMRGFYVAVDKTFRWNDRLWYKTTKGLVAPADRLWQVDAPKFQGLELKGDAPQTLGWVPPARKSTTAYALDGTTLQAKRTIDAGVAIPLTARVEEINKTKYRQTADGLWIKDAQLRTTAPPEFPADLRDDERWVAVNVTQQTLIAFEGRRPVYATLVSTGRESRVKEKDHRTPRGSWRVREKHIAATMDGDGTAAGDLPYSIEDVPYVLYFHQSYALHGAFWHRNYGAQMSHGCINLAPLDAKWLFFFLDPQLPRGWHGVWSAADRPGSRVVVHD